MDRSCLVCGFVALLFSVISLTQSSSITGNDTTLPNHTECIVYNWESMTCTWDLEDTANVSVSMAYSRNMCSSRSFVCPNPIVERGGRDGCNWPSYLAGSHDPFQFRSHCIYYMAKNAYDVIAYGKPRPLNVDIIVKPDKVSSFELVNVTSDHIELGWAVHPSGKPVKYRVTYESPFSTTAVQNTSGTSMMLSNLIQKTIYTITIDCIPLLRSKATGFWSDKETMHVATKSDGRLIITKWKNVGGTMTQFCLSEAEQAQTAPPRA